MASTTSPASPTEQGWPDQPEFDVLVVGAGPTGLALGLELERQGLSCLLVERSADVDPRTRAVMVHAGSLEQLDALGVADDVLAASVVQRRISFHLHDGRAFHIDFGGLDSRFPYYVNIDQPGFERVLGRHLVARGVPVLRGATYLGHTEDAAGITATVRHGEVERQVRARFVAGCDGASSAVRIGLLGDEFPGRTYPFSYLLGEGVPRSDLPTDESAMYVSPTGVVSVLPLPEGRFRVAGPFGGALKLTHGDTLSLEQYTQALDALGFSDTLRLDPVNQLAFYAVHERVAERFRVGRAFLLGDAAHLNAPAGGQAMNSGLADAHDLAERLAAVCSGEFTGAAAEALLEGYHDTRRASALAVIASTNTVSLLDRMRAATPGTDPAVLAELDEDLTALARVWSQLPARRGEDVAV
jgi:2-polyprenyl-6-methoxyphenol hydroxylase-like FAD-dependent oxidoreductase